MRLEQKLFKGIVIFSITVCFTLCLLDLFFWKLKDSTMVASGSVIVFASFYYWGIYRAKIKVILPVFITYIYLVSIWVWCFVGGLTPLVAVLLPVCILISILLTPKLYVKWLNLIWLLSIVIITGFDIFWQTRIVSNEIPKEIVVSNNLVPLIFMVFEIFLINFIKSSYYQVRNRLLAINEKLVLSNKEIENQNNQLKLQHEEIASQSDYIEKINQRLLKQTKKLTQANKEIVATNSNLESVVFNRTKELSDLNQELDLLIYRSSHDFRRPLTSLMGLNEVAKLSVQDPVSIEIFKNIDSTAQSMDSMLDKFLMLYYINSYGLQGQDISFTDALEKVESKLIKPEGDKVTYLVFSEKKFFGERDKRNALIYYILFNLVENALHFNDNEKPKVQVDIKEKQGRLIISVKDFGFGIASEYHDKVFDMYFRGSIHSRGNGLGLFVVRKAMEKLNANYTLESEQNVFTKVEFSFMIN